MGGGDGVGGAVGLGFGGGDGRCDRLKRNCRLQIQPRKQVLDHAD